VQILKKKFNLKKVGHLGTLDPMATGLLIIAINRATKFASLLLQSEKSYRAEVTLGTQTDTDDAEGAVIYTKKYARDGIKVDKPARKIFIKNINNIEINFPIVSFDIRCSKGTYIRSIARDLGIKLSCGAHLSKLIRTSQEKFMLSDACSIDDTNLEKLISLESAFEDLDFIQLNDGDTTAFLHGRSIEVDFEHTDLLRVYDAANKFIAIGKKTSQGFKHEYLV
jgi:tRNA pseudouridine55 synthase